jgi:hypothetical protein
MAAPEDTLPYLAYALFCERILTESDGTLSAMRIIDTLTVTVAIEDEPGKEPPHLLFPPMKLLIGFRKGIATADDKKLILNVVNPSGQSVPVGMAEVTFSPESVGSGANIVFDLQLPWENYGLYWYELWMDGKVLTRVPLTIKPSEKPKENV